MFQSKQFAIAYYQANKSYIYDIVKVIIKLLLAGVLLIPPSFSITYLVFQSTDTYINNPLFLNFSVGCIIFSIIELIVLCLYALKVSCYKARIYYLDHQTNFDKN